MNELITITTGEQGSLMVSSLDVAKGLGIHHKNLLETIRTHQQSLEENFGLVAFETVAVKKDSAFETRNLSETKRSTKPMTIAHLTEDQALLIGSLSRNSKRVVGFKVTLVKSFSEARRRIRELAQSPSASQQLIEQQANRIARLERQMERLLEAQQQAARSLLDVPRSTEPLPEETTRSKIQRLVNGYCRSKGVGQQEVWRKVYDRLYYLYKINIRTHKRSERESWLDVAERSGHIEKLYTIASAELTYNEE